MREDYLTPRIQLETSSGYDDRRVSEDMLMRREVAVVGQIDQEGAFDICQLVRYLNREDASQPITLFVDSNGGELNAGLAVYDTMRQASCPIRTVCLGIAASMAALLFVAGTERAIYPHAEVMVHDPLTLGGGGSALTVQEQSRRLMRARATSAGILARHTGLPIEEVYEMTKQDTFLSAEEAVDRGFADYIVGGEDRARGFGVWPSRD